MIKGRVIGKVWSSRHVGALPPGALLEVQTDGGDLIVAFDPLGCNEKESVLVTQGSVAAAYFRGKNVPSIDEDTQTKKRK